MTVEDLTHSVMDAPLELGTLLARGAAAHPDKVLFTYLAFNGREPQLVTYGELYCQACKISLLLSRLDLRQRPVLLIYPPGPEFAPAFFGTLLARAIAVPAPVPQFEAQFLRLDGIAADCGPGALLTTDSVLAKLQSRMPDDSSLRTCPWLCTGDKNSTEKIELGEGSPSEIAILQYTSGSTANPRGVMVTHSNLAQNINMIEQAFGLPPGVRTVSWLPHFHDMGLIAAFAAPLATGGEAILMSPQAFLQRPLRWLEAISHYRAQVCGGPNFAYELCVRSADRVTLPPLNLDSWQTAFVGAEPVRASTMQTFADRFREAGFRPSALTPCYGMAEATLMVTCKPAANSPSFHSLSRELLKEGLAKDSLDRAPLILTGCGYPAPGTDIRIVEPRSGKPLANRIVGEVWVSGPQVARGYWGEPPGEVFGASLADSETGPFLRTGDLGFLTEDGELVFVERLKDIIVLKGQNYVCHDLEMSASKSHSMLSADGCAAVCIEGDDKTHLLLIAELAAASVGYADEVAQAIRAAWFTDYGLSASTIAFVPMGKLSRTTSGKLQRRLSAARLARGELRAVALIGEALPSAT